jgi:hypothetical protein
MSTRFILMLALLLPTAMYSQRLLVESDTLEGQLLQLIDQEKDQTVKLKLLEEFAKKFPNHEAITWVLSHLQSHQLETKNYERVLTIGLSILSLDPEEVAAAHNCLKAVEALKDVDLIRKWSLQTSQIARKVMLSKKPEYGDDEEIAAWKAKVEFARQVDQYTEYSIYFASMHAKESKTKGELIAVLENRNPMSEYLAQMRTSQKTQVVRQVDIEEAVAAAEAEFLNGQFNEDQLMMVANHYMAKRKEPAKTIEYCGKILDILETKRKPDEVSASEWEQKRTSMIGTANWMMGLLYSSQEKYAAADKHLRASLPLLKNSDMTAGALYHLGYVNYRLAQEGERIRIHDAMRFTQECMAINSAVQAQAALNLQSMKAEWGIQ